MSRFTVFFVLAVLSDFLSFILRMQSCLLGDKGIKHIERQSDQSEAAESS